MKKILISLCTLAATAALQAQILHVPADYATIQQAIDSSANGDTVLVAPGSYIETISIDGKNITLASHYLVTQDTGYISQTIIDGNNGGSVISLDSVDQTALLCGFTIQHGGGAGVDDAGIHCSESSPILRNLRISQNFGTGVRCISSNPILQKVTIDGNHGWDGFPMGGGNEGGGVHCSNSDPILEDVVITGNTAIMGGGGVGLWNSNPILNRVVITGNSSIGLEVAGGTNAYGGGLCCYSSSPVLKNVTISYDTSVHGGGIYCDANSMPVFDSNQRCNIYFNYASMGYDFYSEAFQEAIIDTFTVMYPNSIFAYPSGNFSFDILHSKLVQQNADLYVSPAGDNSHSGLTAGDALKTINHAFLTILADSLHPHAIHLLEGTYSPNSNGEIFPVILPDYINLAGISPEKVILQPGYYDALTIGQSHCSALTGLTIRGGYVNCSASSLSMKNIKLILDSTAIFQGYSSGILCTNSMVSLENITITGNTGIFWQNGRNGGGICFSKSTAILKNTSITANSADLGGGIYCDSSDISLENVTITGNSATSRGGGIYCKNTTIRFDSTYRSNIFLNEAPLGKDIYSTTHLHVVLDTFSLRHLTDLYAKPLNIYSCDILNGKLAEADADLYVSPSGNNNNSGLMAGDPKKTILHAISVIRADSMNPRTIHLLAGTYSPGGNGEKFPVIVPDYINISGVADTMVILDADSLNRVMQFNENTTSHLSGLTLKGARYGYPTGGEGIYCLNSDPVLEDLIITGNTGGGIRCNQSDPVIRNVKITGNTNKVPGGGGVYCEASCPLFENVTISDNIAQNTSYSKGQGGGIYCTGHSSLYLKNTLIENNESFTGGGICCMDSSVLKLENVTIRKNLGNSMGGGVYFSKTSSSMENVTISGNRAGNGGGIYCESTSPVLKNTAITDNHASFGSAIYFDYASPVLTNLTISSNTGTFSAVYCNHNSRPEFINCILWDKTPREIVCSKSLPGDKITISYSDLKGGRDSIMIYAQDSVDWREGNFNADPIFSNEAEFPFALQKASPCVDTGTPDTTGLNLPMNDPAGNPRIWNGRIDMGAYEWNNVGIGEGITNYELRITNYPNPFPVSTTFCYNLKESCSATLEIFDSFGRKIAEPVNMYQIQGKHEILWDASHLPAGIYFYRLEAGNVSGNGKMIVVK